MSDLEKAAVEQMVVEYWLRIIDGIDLSNISDFDWDSDQVEEGEMD